MSFGEFAETPLAALEVLMARLPARQAEQKMVDADVISLPHLKKRDREARVGAWQRVLGAARGGGSAPVASRAKLKLMGIGVRRV